MGLDSTFSKGDLVDRFEIRELIGEGGMGAIYRAVDTKIGRTADDLPYTPHFESLYASYAKHHGEPPPMRQEVWRHLLNLRKAGKLPKMGDAKSRPPAVTDESRQLLRDMLGKDIGKRDRLPYTERFDQIVNDFNATHRRRISPHLVWRLVATLAK